MNDEAPIDRQASALQETVRQILAEASTTATMQANISELRRDVTDLTKHFLEYIAQAKKERDLQEVTKQEQRAIDAQLQADLKRLSDAQSAVAALEKARLEREIAASDKSAARWRDRGAIIATAATTLVLVVKEIIAWAKSP